MASDILHIKDSYYFEVPRLLYSPHYESLEDVPYFLRELHQEDFHLEGDGLTQVNAEAYAAHLRKHHHLAEGETLTPEQAEEHVVHEYEAQMAGKILIPQPFGALHSLYEKESGFAISKFMILQLVVAALLVLIFTWMRKKMLAEHPTKGRLANMFEALMYYIRDEIAIKNIGHDGDKFVPLLWTIFFFILGCNLLGLVPWLGTATGALGTTLALAFAVLLTTFFAGFRAFGPKWIWTGFVPHMEMPDDMPAVMKIFVGLLMNLVIKPLVYVIELLGMFIKHAVLAIRLLANMAAGHLVLLAILGLIISAAQNVEANYPMTATFAILGATLLTVLELGVAFLQAYIFTLLSALFIGSAAHEH